MIKNQSSNTIVLKSMLYGYSNIVHNETTEEHHDKAWYKINQQVYKYFSKPRARASKRQVSEIKRKNQELVNFDTEYYEDKDYSAFVNMFAILEYLMYEVRDIEVRAKFLHLPMKQMREELYEMDGLKEVAKDSDKFIGAILDRIGE